MCIDVVIRSTLILESRPLVESDINRILEIEQFSFAAPWTRPLILEEMNNRNSKFLVFTHAKSIVGYICFWVILDEAHLLNIAVHPNFRSQGIASFFMEKLITMSEGLNLNKIYLEVARRNMPARALYKKFGFNTIGFRKNYYTAEHDDALVMQKWIGRSSIDDNVEQKS